MSTAPSMHRGDGGRRGKGRREDREEKEEGRRFKMGGKKRVLKSGFGKEEVGTKCCKVRKGHAGR